MLQFKGQSMVEICWYKCCQQLVFINHRLAAQLVCVATEQQEVRSGRSRNTISAAWRTKSNLNTSKQLIIFFWLCAAINNIPTRRDIRMGYPNWCPPCPRTYNNMTLRFWWWEMVGWNTVSNNSASHLGLKSFRNHGRFACCYQDGCRRSHAQLHEF